MAKNNQIRMVTKYEQIENLIRDRIGSGELKPGDRIESEYELADRLGVHRFTVNKAISNLVRAGILYRIQGKGTYVTEIQPSTGKRVVGILHGGPTDSLFDSPFYGPIMQGIHRTERFNLFFLGTSTHPTTYQGPVLSENEFEKVDGFFALEIFNDEYLARIAEHKPVVLIDYYSDALGLPGVVIDNAGGARKATQHLLDLGHERIICAGEDPNREHTDPAWLERHRGWQEAMEQAGVTGVERFFIPLSNRSGPEGARAALKMLEWKKRPTAAFVVSDGVALSFMKQLQEKSINVPGDFSIAGFGDSEACAVVEPPLTTVRVNEDDMGKQAALMLDQLIAGRKPERLKVVVPTKFVGRRSTAAAPRA